MFQIEFVFLLLINWGVEFIRSSSLNWKRLINDLILRNCLLMRLVLTDIWRALTNSKRALLVPSSFRWTLPGLDCGLLTLWGKVLGELCILFFMKTSQSSFDYLLLLYLVGLAYKEPQTLILNGRAHKNFHKLLSFLYNIFQRCNSLEW